VTTILKKEGRTTAEMNSAIITTLLSICGTVAGVILGSRLSYRQSFKEKIWDLRRVAYGVILSELAAIEHICASADEYINEAAMRRTLIQKVARDLTKKL
jgi:hypothetical protein